MLRGASALLLSLTLGQVACAPQGAVSTTAPRPGKSPPIRFDAAAFKPVAAERIVARFDLMGITAGKLDSLTLKDCPRNAGTLQLATSVRTTGIANLVKKVEAEAKTEVAGSDGSPSHSRLEVSDGKARSTYDAWFTPGAYRYHFVRPDGSEKNETISVPEGGVAHDLQSSILLLRSWRPKVGEVGHFFVVSGRWLLRADMTYHGADVVLSDGSPRPALRADGLATRVGPGTGEGERRKFQVWFSDDARRVPLRISAETRFGPMTFDLVEYDSKAQSACTGVASESAASPAVDDPPEVRTTASIP